MEHNIDLSRYAIRTDLALEAHELVQEQQSASDVMPGVRIETDDSERGIKVTRLQVETEEAGRTIGKLPGHYITIEVPKLRDNDTAVEEQVARRFTKEFAAFLERLGITEDKKALVVGLGNWNVTPDALGPMVVENLLVTRHLFTLAPESVEEGYREVSALSPGVLGITGIETSEIVFGVVEKSKPDFVICIDALASRALHRVNTTIQISDTGIHPGSGVGNKRKAIDKQTLGVPVIAIGVPTVVFASTIVNDAITYLLGHFGQSMKESSRAFNKLAMSSLPERKEPYTEEDLPDMESRKTFMGLVGSLPEQEKQQLIHEVLRPLGQDLVVTPKEVDDFIEGVANVIATGLNRALHRGVDGQNSAAYTH
ncbi:GPR endopeptidase [Brevibacillus borstelensis]|uniref:GPR endopeptidase n=1 Tax=Brevibacillus borstelensis TaxID=45462 RepID=UPI001D09C431|nr:GPR endopeptidase [Brevibacillus borstelensis]MCC0564465.1 GPR endopeptidase [Brevibacillus borstelensis]MCM3471181.1 GPR endopeptidase [Brevibacillus borstelensis]MCM3559655.1 GPR endopeptidase [Brevibacillus borstelensis]MCM3591367.1 GPR endopeptidase [Brevibacillus borstelensis]MCM3623910.1 GPR endopeptidase [Brevibacillus borstelensis]